MTNKSVEDWAEIAEVVWLLIKVVGVIGLVVGFIVYMIWFAPECQPEKEHDTLIYSLDLGNQLQGSFFIGIGNIQENPKYFFYKEHQGGMILGSVSAKSTVIEERDEIPRLIHYESDNGLCVGQIEYKDDVLVVPKGTVRRNFDADLKALR